MMYKYVFSDGTIMLCFKMSADERKMYERKHGALRVMSKLPKTGKLY